MTMFDYQAELLEQKDKEQEAQQKRKIMFARKAQERRDIIQHRIDTQMGVCPVCHMQRSIMGACDCY